MSRADKNTAISVPKNLVRFFGEPPLVGNESRRDYDIFFDAVVSDVRPTDAIEWLYTVDVINLSWEILRERRFKSDIFIIYQREAIEEAITETADIPSDTGLEPMRAALVFLQTASNIAKRWLHDLEYRSEINAALAADGYPSQVVLALAYQKAASQIDAADRRIANAEARRTTLVREIERRREALAVRLEKASRAVIDAQFTHAKINGNGLEKPG
jgi:hypothetical protein